MFLKSLEEAVRQRGFPKKLALELKGFYASYLLATSKNKWPQEKLYPILLTYLEELLRELKEPFLFQPYHQRLKAPIDYYRFGIDLIRPLVQVEISKVFNWEVIDKIESQINRRENVILLGNHQIEPDPQLISLFLEQKYPTLSQEMIFVAGHRVISDPLAIPLSKGRNLLCIFSKRHIEIPPEKKDEKIRHNQRTMKQMSLLLEEGGKCIYVAPSGGRDRPNTHGKIEISPFDPASIEMFFLMSQKSKTPTHFYPLALSSYDLLPPPEEIKKDLGEKRAADAAPFFLWIGEEIDMQAFNDPSLNKKNQREKRALFIWNLVKQAYETFP